MSKVPFCLPEKAKSLCALSQPLFFWGESKAICLGGRAAFGAVHHSHHRLSTTLLHSKFKVYVYIESGTYNLTEGLLKKDFLTSLLCAEALQNSLWKSDIRISPFKLFRFCHTVYNLSFNFSGGLAFSLSNKIEMLMLTLGQSQKDGHCQQQHQLSIHLSSSGKASISKTCTWTLHERSCKAFPQQLFPALAAHFESFVSHMLYSGALRLRTHRHWHQMRLGHVLSPQSMKCSYSSLKYFLA